MYNGLSCQEFVLWGSQRQSIYQVNTACVIIMFEAVANL